MKVSNNPKRYFWVVLFLSANFMASIFTLFYLNRGLTYSQIFILYTILVVSMFLFEVPTGFIGDRFGRKASILVGLIGWVIYGTGLLFAHSFWAFAALFVLFGFNCTCASGSDEALIYDSLKQEKKEGEMKKHMSIITSAKVIPLIILAPIGSFIARTLAASKFNILLIGNLTTTVIAFFIALTLVEPKKLSGPHEIRSPFTHIKSSIEHIKKSNGLFSLFLNKTLILIPATNLFAILWQPYLKNSGVPIAFFGVITALAAIMVFVLSKNIDKINSRISGKKAILLSGLLIFVAFVFGAIFQNIIVGLLFFFIIKITSWFVSPQFSHYMNQHIESHNRATVLSTLSMIDSLFDVVIYLSTAYIASLGIKYSFAFSAIIVLIALVFFRVKDKHIKKN